MFGNYDEIGNMTYNSQVGSYTYWKQVYGTKPHAVYQAGANTYGYDANGNMTSSPGKTITYDYDNRPTSINGTSFVYDYSGQRVKKNSTIYIGKLYECTGGTCTKYIFAGSNRIAYKIGSATYYYHTDHLGSSSVVTDRSGIMKEEIYYYPFGKTRSNTGTLNVKHKFTGQELDDETGLYNYGARYYDPEIGRFVSADSIVPDFSNPQSLNRYSYALNNPVIYTDPSGHEFLTAALLITAFVVGAVSAGAQSDWNVEEMFAGAVVGAVSAGYGVIGGAAIYSITPSPVLSGMAGGATGGAISSVATGGNVLQGMGIGAIAGGVAGGIGGLKYGSPYAKLIAQVGSAAIVGGAASELTGGSFSEGASIGALSAAIVWGVERSSSSTVNTGGGKHAFDLVVNKVEVIEVVSLEAKVTGNILQDINEGVQYYAVCMGEEVVGPGVFEASGVGGRDYFTYRAWQHAATTSSKTYGTAFLVQPLKSSIVSGFLRWAGRWVPIMNIVGLARSNWKCWVGEYKYLTQ